MSINFWKGITSFGNFQGATNANISVYFSKRRKLKKIRKPKCAAECLAIFPVMRYFLETIIQPQGLCPEAVKSFLAMALVIDQCHGGIQWKATTRASLLSAVEDCNYAFQAAFPDAPMIRKWHWHLHLPDSYAKFEPLPSCFTCERKHKTISSFDSRLLKTQSFEANLLEQILAIHSSCGPFDQGKASHCQGDCSLGTFYEPTMPYSQNFQCCKAFQRYPDSFWRCYRVF